MLSSSYPRWLTRCDLELSTIRRVHSSPVLQGQVALMSPWPMPRPMTCQRQFDATTGDRSANLREPGDHPLSGETVLEMKREERRQLDRYKTKIYKRERKLTNALNSTRAIAE